MSIKKLWNGWAVILMVAIVAVLYLVFLYPGMMRWGATDSEVAMPLPGDELVPVVGSQATRAVTIHAPAAQVWRWVVQLGQERAGFYSNDWLENLTLADIHNADEIRPAWQTHQLDDAVLGAGGSVYGQTSGWHIQAYDEGKLLYLWSAIVIQPIDAHTSRLLTRTRAAPAPLYADMIGRFSYDWMHFVMERGMLLGIKARAEGTLAANQWIEVLSDVGWIAATLSLLVFFLRRRARWWALLPLAYAAAIIVTTSDEWSAMAGFLWWGIAIAGFVVYGRAWWKGFALSIVAVVLMFVSASYPHVAFGLLFLLLVLIGAARRLFARADNQGAFAASPKRAS